MDVMALGYVYKVPTPEWQSVVLQAQHAGRTRTQVNTNERRFDPAADLSNLVVEATSMRAFTTDLVPTVFRLTNYMNAVIQDGDPTRTAR